MANRDTPKIEPPEIMPPRRGMARALIAITVALVLLAVFGLYLQYRPVPFDPVAWRDASRTLRSRMLESLLDQTNFVGFARDEVRFYLGPAEFDERLFWYDLGSAEGDPPVNPSGDVGAQDRLFGVFHHDEDGLVLEVLYSHRRPLLGSADFDPTTWANATPDTRRAMFTSALRTIRSRGLDRRVVIALLGPPDGERVRAEYAVGSGMIPYAANRALIIEYNRDDIVDTSFVQE